MYKVIKSFVDLQDNGHRYNAGDSFPRDGVTVSDARIKKLLGASNRQGTPLIKEIKEKDLNFTSPAPAEKLEQGAPLKEQVPAETTEVVDVKVEAPKKGSNRKANKKN